ncbi:MAG: nucleotide exchange factor GrpE [Eubacterium sp.]|jgi:molecular chaperone GrpE|nr:nucleotide exchange factor GrpE [Eubacterium sp.]
MTEVMMDKEKMQEQTEETVENTEVKEENTAEETVETVEENKEPTMEEKLEEAQKQAKDNLDKYIRQLAEFENFRKRSNSEKTAMYSNGVRDTVEKLLPVIDNFERAVEAADDKEDPMYKGVEMILKQFMEILENLGVKEIPSKGEPFDPNVHSAVMHIDDESCDENVVVEVFQKGYTLGDKVIRPSMVKVAN